MLAVTSDLVEVTVEAVMKDRVEVLQPAPVECVEEVAARACLLKACIHLVTVLQLKQEVWNRRGDALVLSQVTQPGVLAESRGPVKG